MMEPFQRILCPIDFSSTSEKALRYAERLAAAAGAEIVLVHAFDTPQTYDPAGQTRPADASLKSRLEQIRPASSQVKFTHLLHAGVPGEVICWLAQDLNCDVIVLGTHGHSGLKHLLLGSVAEYVMRHARCPVLTVRDRPANEPKLNEPMILPLPPPRLM